MVDSAHSRFADILVVGGGLAGLTAATYLARSGHQVTVLESRGRLGGRATTDDRDGVLFNQGPHALYRGGEAMPVLRELGIEPVGGMPGGRSVVVLDGRVAPLGSNIRTLLASPLLPRRARPGAVALFGRLVRTKPTTLVGLSVEEWLDQVTSRDDVRRIGETLVRLATYANAPDLLCASAAVDQIQRALRAGVLYLDGGWVQLVDALAARATDAGVRIVTGQRVSGLTAAPGGPIEVTVGHRDAAWSARAVVLAATGPQPTAALLGLAVDRFAAAGPPVEAACLDLALDTEPVHRFALGADTATYFSVHSGIARLTPPGRHSAAAARYLPIGGPRETSEQSRAIIADHLSTIGIAGASFERFQARLTVAHGLPLASAGGLSGRPAVAVAERPGVFLAGDWIGAQGQLTDAVLASAKAAAKAASSWLTLDAVPERTPVAGDGQKARSGE